MRMIVKNIEQENNIIYVTCDTDVGMFKGRWKQKQEPLINKEYFFELNIDELERNEVSIIQMGKNLSPEVRVCGDEVFFKGICEEIDDVYVIRFASDWIELIGIKDGDLGIKQGDWILFSIGYKRINIYTYEI